MLRILLIDNFDSFTYNLVQLIRETEIPHRLKIVTNMETPDEQISGYDKVLISPGPGLPQESGNLMQWITACAARHSILGVCLGHQALACHFGASLRQLTQSFHGFRSLLYINSNSSGIFKNIPTSIQCWRYHSWVVDENTLPADIHPTAFDPAGHIMAFAHKTLDIQAVQFHPESFMTEHGLKMMHNWLTG